MMCASSNKAMAVLVLPLCYELLKMKVFKILVSLAALLASLAYCDSVYASGNLGGEEVS